MAANVARASKTGRFSAALPTHAIVRGALAATDVPISGSAWGGDLLRGRTTMRELRRQAEEDDRAKPSESLPSVAAAARRKLDQAVASPGLGGLGLAQWSQLIYPLIILLLCGAYLWANAGNLNAMTVGDETAATLGIPVGRFRLTVFVVGAMITGVMVAFSGIIGFVGLMIPHIVRLIVGGDYTRVLPVSALCGAIFLLWADIFARTVMAPDDIPIGIVTGLIGGVFFVWLLRRNPV